MKAFFASALTATILAGGSASGQAQTAATVIRIPDKPAQMEITDLRRTDDGTTITLHGVVSSTSGQATQLGYTFEIYLIDFKNRRRYSVITDSSLVCLCAPAGPVAVPAAGSAQIWAKFPAPPETVTSMSVGWGPVEPVLVQVTK